MPGCTAATTIPSQAGSSADRAGGSRSIGPSEWASTTEQPLPSRPLRRGTIEATDGMFTPGMFTPGRLTAGRFTCGRFTCGRCIDGSTAGIEMPVPPTPGIRRSRSWRRGLPGSSSWITVHAAAAGGAAAASDTATTWIVREATGRVQRRPLRSTTSSSKS